MTTTRPASATASGLSLEWIVSVDDHAIEPPTVWLDRLPAKYHDVAPRMVETERGAVWRYEDMTIPTSGLSVAAGKRRDEFTPDPVAFDEMRPAAYNSVARLEDMNRAGILASMCFPSFPRFCGQVFYEATDKELALLCVRAYNDWMIEEWCGSAPGRYIPLIIVPLWDPPQAALEIERCAELGARGLAFSENPEPLGLPTIHNSNRYWDPMFAAAQDTETIVCMHAGSSSQLPSVCSDAPQLANLAMGATRTAGTMLSWLFSDNFERMPRLKIALSEGNIGWMPYFLERAEQVVDRQRHWAQHGSFDLYEPDAESGKGTAADLDLIDIRAKFRDHIYGCFLDDEAGIRCLDLIGEDNVMVETDYPHSDSTWPDSIDVVKKLIEPLPPETQYKVLRGNAERLFRFTPAPEPVRGTAAQ